MNHEDPYLPPASEPSDPPAVQAQSEPLATAGHGTRLANLLVDSLFIGMLVVAVFWFLSPESPRLVTMVIYFTYYFVLEGFSGRTLGKQFTGTKVVNAEGGRLNLSQVFTRTLMRFIPFEPFSFLGAEPEGWHDTLSRSFVIKSR